MQNHNNITYKGVTFPNSTAWGRLENHVISLINNQIKQKFSNKNNLFINGTWFSPEIDSEVFDEVISMEGKYDNVFFLTTVDPSQISVPEVINLFQQFGSPTVYFIGNFDFSPYEFNFISFAINDDYIKHNEGFDLELTEIKYKFINYNRRPDVHRKKLVTEIVDKELHNNAIVTLGSNPHSDDLCITLDEKYEDFEHLGHWNGIEDCKIPNDILSLGNIEYWKHHFLNVVSETNYIPHDSIFVSEKTFKPIFGLRPFLINGNTRTYDWLRKYGFKTFTHYFPFSNLESTNENELCKNIIDVLQWIDREPNDNLLEMYNAMLPDLYHNKERMTEFANEQRNIMENLFSR